MIAFGDPATNVLVARRALSGSHRLRSANDRNNNDNRVAKSESFVLVEVRSGFFFLHVRCVLSDR